MCKCFKICFLHICKYSIVQNLSPKSCFLIGGSRRSIAKGLKCNNNLSSNHKLFLCPLNAKYFYPSHLTNDTKVFTIPAKIHSFSSLHYFFFFCYISWHVRSQFPDHGLNPHISARSLKHWTAREFISFLCIVSSCATNISFHLLECFIFLFSVYGLISHQRMWQSLVGS